jgi:hypothetical protein
MCYRDVKREIGMKLYRVISLALIGSLALSAASFAAGPEASPAALPTSIVVHTMNGLSTVVPIDSKKATELLADPSKKELKAGMIFFVANGKAYIVEDHMMPDGKMLSYDLSYLSQ